MLRTRVIPCLLLKNQGLVKTIRFKDPKYVGCPINAVKIFNDKEVDELIFLDITATVEKKQPNFQLISEIAGECFMPLGYGGGISSMEDIERVFGLGVEKVCINSAAIQNPPLISDAARVFGSQSIVVSIDTRKNLFGKHEVFTMSGTKNTKRDPMEYAREMEDRGAGELVINSIDQDGTMQGFDVQLITRVSGAVTIPVIAAGGAGSVEDLRQAVLVGGASAVAAGSMFVFYGKHRAVLITYPAREELEKRLP